MRVLLDATAIPADRGGVGRYIEGLVPALVSIGLDLVVACQERDAVAMGQLAPEITIVNVPPSVARRPARLVWEQMGLPKLSRRVGADLLHSPHYTMPRYSSVPTVVTLHDATFFSHPELHSPVKGRFFRAATRTAVRRAGGLVVPSAATRDAVIHHVGSSAEPSAFTIAHHGVDSDVFHPVDQQDRLRVQAALGLEGPYLAFLGTLEPRKNVPALIRGWVAAVGDQPEPPALVLAGGRGWDDGVDAAVAAVPEHLHLARPGYLPLEDLAAFLSGAEAVAYPSLGEGFGLPVLEAMACGAAVLTTRELSLPEVGGSAVEYCGTDEAEIAVGLRSLLGQPERRAELRGLARQRAAGFTWQATALRHVEAYERALADSDDGK